MLNSFSRASDHYRLAGMLVEANTANNPEEFIELFEDAEGNEATVRINLTEEDDIIVVDVYGANQHRTASFHATTSVCQIYGQKYEIAKLLVD